MTGRNNELGDTTAIGNLLIKDREAIESKIGYQFNWQLPPGRKSTAISVTQSGFDVLDPKDWNLQFNWISDRQTEFDDMYRARVKDLNPAGLASDADDAEQEAP